MSVFSISVVATLFSVVAQVSTAQAAVLKPSGVSASSSHSETEGVNYEEKNLTDSKQSTVWVEGDSGSGLGAWVQIDLPEETEVESFRIWNGNWYTHDFWQRHNRVKELEVEASDGTKYTFNLADEMAPETVEFAKPVKTSFLRFKIKGIHKGSTFNDTCLSEIQLLDAAPEAFVPVSSFTASSTYPPDGDGSYEPKQMADHLLDSMWCEASEEGDGTGEWVEFQFESSTSISKVQMNNGNAYSFKYNMKANRAKAMTLTFSDGSSEQVSVKPSMMKQVVSFSPRTTSKVRVTFDEIMKGTEYNDLCMSEMVFLE